MTSRITYAINVRNSKNLLVPYSIKLEVAEPADPSDQLQEHQAFLEMLNEQQDPDSFRQALEFQLAYHFFHTGDYRYYLQKLVDMVQNEYGQLIQGQKKIDTLNYWAQEKAISFERDIFYDVTVNEPINPFQAQIFEKDILDYYHNTYQDHVSNIFKEKLQLETGYYDRKVKNFLEYHLSTYLFDEEDWFGHTKALIREIRKTNIDGVSLHTDFGESAMEWIDMRQEKAKKSTINNGKSSDRIIGLVFYYLQQQYKISRTQEKTKYAAMVLEMLGRPTDKIRDSRVYNVLRQPLYHAEAPQAKKALITDLKNVRELFRQIINFEIVKKIDDDIKSLDNLID